MRGNRSVGYTLLAVCHIALNEKKGGIMSHEIAKEYDIPLHYLLKLLQQLVKSDILLSKRGPQGGFTLARSAKKIKMLDVIETVDGPMVGRLAMSKRALSENFGRNSEDVYGNAVTLARNIFKKTSIYDLLQEQ